MVRPASRRARGVTEISSTSPRLLCSAHILPGGVRRKPRAGMRAVRRPSPAAVSGCSFNLDEDFSRNRKQTRPQLQASGAP